MGNDKVIKAHGEGQHKSGGDTRHKLRQHHLEKGLCGGGTEIQRRLIGILAGLSDLRHYTEYYVRQVEGNVGDQYGVEAQGNPEGYEAQHQRDTRNDVGIEHRDIGDAHDGVSGPGLHVVNAYGRDGTKHCCDKCRQERNDDSVSEGSHNGLVRPHFHVPVGGEAGPLGAGTAAVKGKHHQGRDGRVHEKYDDGEVAVGGEFL